MNRRELLKLAAATCLPALPALPALAAPAEAGPKFPFRYFMRRVDPRYDDTVYWPRYGVTQPSAAYAFRRCLFDWRRPVAPFDFKAEVRRMIRGRHHDPKAWGIEPHEATPVIDAHPARKKTRIVFAKDHSLEDALYWAEMLGYPRSEIYVPFGAEQAIYWTKGPDIFGPDEDDRYVTFPAHEVTRLREELHHVGLHYVWRPANGQGGVVFQEHELHYVA